MIKIKIIKIKIKINIIKIIKINKKLPVTFNLVALCLNHYDTACPVLY
jgi:hypothetical protein